MGRLFRSTGVDDPSDLRECDLIAFCTAGDPANNTVYQRASKVCTFLAWCQREGHIDSNPAAHLRDVRSPLRTYRRTYGKVQAKHPGRWLTREEAYGRLVGSCRDGTVVGLRDELVIRLGLLGLRLSEIGALRLDNLRQLPSITWTGKGRKPRRVVAGSAFREVLDTYLAQYPDPGPDAPLICTEVLGARRQGGPPRLNWHHGADRRTLFLIVNGRAKAAGLGHVAPHDLRRTAAGLLHTAVGPDGAHHFDLLDIQRVLGHSDPATTMRSYLEPMDTEVLDRAAAFLD
ncbi:MAG TPA: tyrosine-type recombinase/integrase [Acidimicrobiales bacterium]|nr:tyrosine-type recombinase/integrase [Acidimicrobiales bacterium]